jgi:hydrogenase maturation protease
MDPATNSFAARDASLRQAPVLVLGLGNILIEDEGVGIAAIEYLQQHYRLPDDVELLDGGTSGMALLDDLRQRKKLIVVDAVRTGAPPGTLVILKGDEVPAFFRSKVSPHQLALSDVLAALTLTGDKTSDICVMGVVPGSLETRIGLSHLVASQLKPLISCIINELENVGYRIEPFINDRLGPDNRSGAIYSTSNMGGIPL